MDSYLPTVGVLVLGVVTVVGGVLLLRLHAFLALIAGALVVGALTPQAAVEGALLRRQAVDVLRIEPGGAAAWLGVPVRPGARYFLLRADASSRRLERVATLELVAAPGDEPGTRAVVRALDPDDDEADDGASEALRIEPGDVVVHQDRFAGALALARTTVGERLARGFGNTCTKIGILIALASIVGLCLLKSGAADRIVRSTLNLLGERRAPAAFLGSGFLLGIPVFFDTVFYLMVPLGKAMYLRTQHSYLFYVLTIVAGATMAHSLVPPTPGPLFVAEQLGVDLGVMVIGGCVVGAVTVSVGYLYAHLVNRRCELPLRDTADFSAEEIGELSRPDTAHLPALWLALLPIVLPVVLISGSTVLESAAERGVAVPPALLAAATALGNKNIALLIAAAIAMATYAARRARQGGSRDGFAASVQSALASAGTIVLITAAGGAFGEILQQTGVASLIRKLPLGSSALVLSMAFLITAAIRTAQGSATVAMITTVGILAGIASPAALGFHPVYLALAIGCGSKPISWMNDSGFWVIVKMSGMTEQEGLKYVTPMTALMGLVGLIVVLLGATLFPLV